MELQQSYVANEPEYVNGTDISIVQSETSPAYLIFRTTAQDGQKSSDSRLPVPVAHAFLAALSLREEIMEDLQLERRQIDIAMSHLGDIMTRAASA